MDLIAGENITITSQSNGIVISADGKVKTVNGNSPDENGNVQIVLPDAQVNSDWNAESGKAQILNKPTKLTDFTNDLKYVKINTIPQNADLNDEAYRASGI